MNSPAEYRNPTARPLFRGGWREVARAWVVGAIATALILALL